MRNNPERFVTFVLGTFMLVYYVGVGYQIGRIWRRIHKSPLIGLASGSWIEKFQIVGSFTWPFFVLLWAYCPEWFRGIPAFRALENWPVRMAGLLCLCLGAAIISIAYKELGNHWRIGVDPDLSGTFVRSGIYSSVRHPVYSALWLYFLGVFLMAPTLLFGIFWAAAGSIIAYQARREEAFLCEKFGDTYRKYMRFTGRYFPLLF